MSRMLVTAHSRGFWRVQFEGLDKVMGEFSYEDIGIMALHHVGRMALSVDMGDLELSRRVADTISRTLEIYQRYQDFGHGLGISHENYYTNMEYVIDSPKRYCSLKGWESHIRGRPVILCGAGPSLRKHKEQLKDVLSKGSHVVVAAGSALRVFQEWGMQPDFALAVDPYDTSWSNVFAHLTADFWEEVPLIAKLSLDPLCFKSWMGPVAINGGLDGLSFLRQIDGLPCYGLGMAGVSTAFMRMMENRQSHEPPCYLAGIDLCLSEGQQYADGHELHHERNLRDRCEHEGLETTAVWMQEANAMAMIAATSEAQFVRLAESDSVLPVEGIRTVSQIVPAPTKRHFEGFSPVTPQMVREMKRRASEVVSRLERMDSPEDMAMVRPWVLNMRNAQMHGEDMEKGFLDNIISDIIKNIKQAFNV